MVMAAMIAWDVCLFSREVQKRNWLAMVGTLLFVVFSCAALQLALPGFNSGSTYGSGGVLGAWLGVGLNSLFSPAGVFLLIACGLLSGWMLSPLWVVTMPGLKLAALPMSMRAAEIFV